MKSSGSWKILLLLAAFTVAVFYGYTLRNGFVHDDHGQVEHNTYIQSFVYLSKVFTSCIWESAVGNCKDTYYYRPVQSLSYMLTYQLSSHPWMFHLVNLVYFAIDVWLIYLLVRLLTGNRLLAVLTASLFLIHPLNSEVVNWIAAVPELLYVLFVLLSTIFFILYRRMGFSKYLWGLFAAYTFGILAKEPAVFLPFVFLILDAIYFKKKLREILKWENIKPYMLSLGAFFIYLWTRLSVLGGLGADPYYQLTFPQRIYIFIDLFGSYFRKLIFPYPLNLFYTFHPAFQVLRPDFIIAVFTVLGFIGLLIVSMKKKWKIISFALTWYFVFLAPSLIFINSIGENLFAERHVFASTIGFALIVAVVVNKLGRLGKLGRFGAIVVIGGLAVVSFFVIQARNQLWLSDESIYTDTLKKSPDADLVRYNLAYFYEQASKTDLAKEQYGIVLKRNLWRSMDKIFNNLGDIARKEGDYRLATIYFQKSVEFNPVHVEAYNNLGALYFEQGDLLKSLVYLCQANRLNPAFEPANNNYDRLVGTVQGMDGKTFGILYKSLLSGKIFQQASENNRFTLQNKDCITEDGCLLTFNSSISPNAYIFSFLIAGQTDDGQIIRPRRVGIRQSTGDVVLDLDKKWADKKIHFFFPTCDRVLY